MKMILRDGIATGARAVLRGYRPIIICCMLVLAFPVYAYDRIQIGYEAFTIPSTLSEESTYQFRVWGCNGSSCPDEITDQVTWTADPKGGGSLESSMVSTGPSRGEYTIGVIRERPDRIEIRAFYGGLVDLKVYHKSDIRNTIPTFNGAYIATPSTTFADSGIFYLNKEDIAELKAWAIWDDGSNSRISMDWSMPPTGVAAFQEYDDGGIISGRLTPSSTLTDNSSVTVTVSNPVIPPGYNTLSSSVSIDQLVRIRAKQPDYIELSGPSQVQEDSQSTIPYSADLIWTNGDNTVISPQWGASCCGLFDTSGYLHTSTVSQDTNITVTGTFYLSSISSYYPDIQAPYAGNLPVTITNRVLQGVGISDSDVTQLDENTSFDFDAVAIYSSNPDDSIPVNADWKIKSNTGNIPADFSTTTNGLLQVGGVTNDEDIVIEASYTDDGVTQNTSRTITVKNVTNALSKVVIQTTGGIEIPETEPIVVTENSQKEFRAQAFYGDGLDSEVTMAADWSTDLPSAFVNSSGQLFVYEGGITTGKVNVSYQEGGVTKTDYIIVKVVSGDSSLGPIDLISVNDNSVIGDGESISPQITSDGRYVAFASEATNLITNGCIVTDIYLRDTVSETTELITYNYDGTYCTTNTSGYLLDRYSAEPDVSADGESVTFRSQDEDLVAIDVNDWKDDIFLRDTGLDQTSIVSLDNNDQQPSSPINTRFPIISDNGQFVVFQSWGPILGSGVDDSSYSNIYLRDLTGNTTEIISRNSSGVLGDWHSGNLTEPGAAITADGSNVAFVSEASNLVPEVTNTDTQHVYVRRRSSGTTILVSKNNSGQIANCDSKEPAISDDGNLVAFTSCADNLVQGTSNTSVYIRDINAGTTGLISKTKEGVPAPGFRPAISSDGRFVAFVSSSSNLVTGDTNGVSDVFVYDRLADKIKRVSVGGEGEQADQSVTVNDFYASKIDISDNGQYIVWSSSATTLVEGDNNGKKDIFRKEVEIDEPAGSVWLVPVSTAPQIGTQAVFEVHADFSQAATLGGAIDVTYDNEKLEFVSFVYDSALADDALLRRQPNSETPGELIGIAFGNFAGYSGVGIVGRLTFNTQGLGAAQLDVQENESPLDSFYSASTYIAQLVSYEGASIVIGGTAPTVADDAQTINEDEVFTGTLDVDNPDGRPLSYTIVTPPAKGTVEITDTSTGQYSYTPYENTSGMDVFTYMVNDGILDSNNADVSFTISAVNDAPQADAGVDMVVNEGTSVTLDGTGSDDVDSLIDSYSWVKTAGPSVNISGGATESASFFAPPVDSDTDLTFELTVTDDENASDTDSVIVTVKNLNAAPVASPQSVGTPEDNAVTITLTGSDQDGDPLTFAVASSPANGSLGPIAAIDATSASVDYMPDADFAGLDSFTFTVNDGNATSAVATVDISVAEVNDVPTIAGQGVNTDEDTAITVTLTGSDADGDSLTFAIDTPPSDGTLGPVSPVDSTSATVEYAPGVDFNGSDSFTFTADDGTATSTTATVDITVNAINDVPTADGQSVTTDEDTQLTIILTGSDVDDDNLSLTVASSPSNGSLGGITPIDATSASVDYTPDADFNGSDSFIFTANDGAVDSAPATVNITVNAINDTPTATGGSTVTSEQTPVLGLVRGEDADNDALTFSVVSAPTQGSVEFTDPAAGLYTYTSDSGVSGSDSFTFKVSDGVADSTIETVDITIHAVTNTYAVTKTADTSDALCDSDCSLREAVQAANSSPGYDIITVPAGTYQLSLSGTGEEGALTGDLDITGHVKLSGAGAAQTIIDGGALDRVFHVFDGMLAEFSGVTVRNGAATNGAGIYSVGGDVRIDDSEINANAGLTSSGTGGLYSQKTASGEPVHSLVLTNSTVSGNCGPYGGGIWANNILIVSESTIADSAALGGCSDGGGGIHFNGGYGLIIGSTLTGNTSTGSEAGAVSLYNTSLSIINTTIANNSGTSGGGIQYGFDSQLRVVNSTVVNNTASQDGGGIYNSAGRSVEVVNTILAQNSSTLAGPDCYGTVAASDFMSLGSNLIGNTSSCSIITVASDQTGVAAGLDTFTDDGTPGGGYYPLLASSPAVDSGNDSFCPGVDQRGFLRPADGNSDTVSICDVGAFEFGAVAPSSPPVADAQSVTVDENTPLTITLTGSDADGDSLSFAIAAGPSNGNLGAITPVDATSATVDYTPAADFNGGDSFTFTVNDGTSTSTAATVDITVNAVNDTPTANAQSVTTDEDTQLTITLTGSDVDGDSLSFTIAAGPSNGSLGAITPVDSTSATVAYTPGGDFNGGDSFTFTVNDGTVASTAATVNITVNAVNDAPVAVDDSAATNEDTQATIGVLANDSDLDGDTLTVGSVAQPANGSVVISGGGTGVDYTPDLDFTGTDTFTYTAADGNGGSDTATVTITVNAVNTAPVADAQSVATDEDTPITITLTGSDADVDSLSFAVAGGPANGTLGTITPVDSTSATVAYTPGTDFNGNDSFTFTVNDGTVTSTAATVDITVNAINDAPTANAQSVTTEEDTAITITLTGADVDGDSLSFAIAAGPSNGSLDAITPVDSTSATVAYTPGTDFNGSDSFTFTVNDGTVASTAATVNITVNAVNDAPVAVNDSYSLDEDTQLSGVDVLGNDSDVEGDTLSVTSNTSASNGSVSIAAGGSLSYTPNADFNGSDSFTYDISDGNGGSDTATVTITVNAINDAPVAVDDSVSTTQNIAKTIAVLGNDGDADGDPLSIGALDTQSAQLGTITDNGDGTVTYIPPTDYTGTDSFTYQASDGALFSGPATVTVEVTAAGQLSWSESKLEGNIVDTKMGGSVNTAGDVNGDGHMDMIVGAWLYGSSDTGRVEVYYGSSTGIDLSGPPDWAQNGSQGWAYFGHAVSTAGNVNGDEYDDIIVGAYSHDSGETNEGKIFVYYGSSSGPSLSPDWTAEGDQAEARFGSSVASAGDIDGDGFGDILVSAPGYDEGVTDLGRVYVYYGSGSGLSQTAVSIVSGAQGGAGFGGSIGSAGDVNGDEKDDIIVGEASYDTVFNNAGRAYLYLGSDQGLEESATWVVDGYRSGTRFGNAVGTAGNVNGDEYDDIIVGGWKRSTTEDYQIGQVYVYYGGPTGPSNTEDWSVFGTAQYERVGSAVSTAGDVNGDGYDDILIGAQGEGASTNTRGKVYVYYGGSSGLVQGASPEWTFESDLSTHAAFGKSVSTLGDVNDDGVPDIVIGASLYDNPETNEGAVFVEMSGD